MARKGIQYFGIIALLLLASGCVSHANGVVANQTSCCMPDKGATYDIASTNVPDFMRDMVEVSLHATMQTLGYSHRREAAPDLSIHAEYEQIDYEQEAADKPKLGERTTNVEPQQFVARINIQIRDRNDKAVWTGHVQRLHSVGPGEYMHRGNAANSIASALVELIQSQANR